MSQLKEREFVLFLFFFFFKLKHSGDWIIVTEDGDHFLLTFLIQMLISSRTTLTDIPKNRHLSGYLLAQSGWQIKLTITTTFQYRVINWTDMSCLCVVVQSLSRVQLFATPRTAACQGLLSFTTAQSLLRFMSIESATPSNHLILCCPLLLLPSVFPSIRVFSSESALPIK